MSLREEEKTVAGLLVFLLRSLRHWPQAEMSSASGIQKSQLSLYELGRVLPSEANLRRLAAAAGLPWIEARKALLQLHAWHRLATGEPDRRVPIPFAGRVSIRIGQAAADAYGQRVHPFLCRRLPAFSDPEPESPEPSQVREAAVTGLLIALLRALRHWTKEDLAAASGVPRSQLSVYELGRVAPRRHTLERIIAAVGVPLEEAFEALPLLRELVRAAQGRRIHRPADRIRRFGSTFFLLAVARTLPDGASGV
ncbi:MAG: helix-turn-helix transcriptional regulator [Acidobacteriota bacterium]